MSLKNCHPLRIGFDLILRHFGPRRWWPGDSPFEVMVGAILTQNTNWKNVEKAISNLKANRLLDAKKLLAIDFALLADLIRPAGYFRIKTKRLKNFLEYFVSNYDADVEVMKSQPQGRLREELLGVSGLGPETVDSILLYALEKPAFVVDTYTKRILLRHKLCDEEADYHQLQEYFIDSLPEDVAMYNEYHALLVETGKNFCRPRDPKCDLCPLNSWNRE